MHFLRMLTGIFLTLGFFQIPIHGSLKESVSNFLFESQPEQAVKAFLAQADIKVGGDNPWDIQVHDARFYTRVLKDQSLGLGESYMEGWWDCPNLDQFFFRILRAEITKNLKPTWAMRWSVLRAKLFNTQDKSGSLKVIEEHYELGNGLYQNMLDESMAYSCGYWKNATTLEEAQRNKFDLIAQKLDLKKGMKVLDIGCGWGGFAQHIAKYYGVEVVGITLSERQASYARGICQGLPVEIVLKDYRDVEESFDRIISIGMFEHVGVKNYRVFMEIAHRCLKDDGLFLLHTIGNNTATLVGDPWSCRYIFPNGILPSVVQIGEAIEDLFVMEDWHNFGAYYDHTLLAWYQNFNKNWDTIKSNYPDPFYRMWKYYLLSFAGAFRSRDIELWQIVLSKKGVLGGYTSVR